MREAGEAIVEGPAKADASNLVTRSDLKKGRAELKADIAALCVEARRASRPYTAR
jgi:hypothetical protein